MNATVTELDKNTIRRDGICKSLTCAQKC